MPGQNGGVAREIIGARLTGPWVSPRLVPEIAPRGITAIVHAARDPAALFPLLAPGDRGQQPPRPEPPRISSVGTTSQ